MLASLRVGQDRAEVIGGHRQVVAPHGCAGVGSGRFAVGRNEVDSSVAAGIDDASDCSVQAVYVGVGLGYQPAPEHQAAVTQLSIGGDDPAAKGAVPVGEYDQVKRLRHAITGLQVHEVGVGIIRQPVNDDTIVVSAGGNLTAEVMEKVGPA